MFVVFFVFVSFFQTESLDDSHPTNPEFASNTAAGTDLKNQLRLLKLLIADFLHLLQERKGNSTNKFPHLLCIILIDF